jgi:hypothetical protein
MSDNININVTENIDQVNIVASEVVEVVDLNLYATTEDVTINVTEEIIQVNINKVTSSNITKTSDLINDGEDGTSTYVETDELGAVAFSNDYNDLDNLPTIPESVTKTSDLINDGEDGVNPFITLEDIPPIDISTLVPYTGATQDVDLGENGISAGFFKFDTTPTDIPEVQGAMFWDEDDNTVDVILNGYRMKIGEDTFYPVKNQSGSTITKGTNVKFAGTVGSSGRLLILPFLANGTDPSYVYMGVTAEDIADGEDGKVLWFGRLRGLNTNAFNEGDILYASTTSAGGFQTAIPTGANNIVQVSAVIKKSVNQGVIFIRPQIEPLLFKPENVANKSTTTTLGTSDTLYPTQNAVKVYADTKVDKVTTSGVERAYIINADGSQGTKATSEFGDNYDLGDWLVNRFTHNNAVQPYLLGAAVNGGNVNTPLSSNPANFKTMTGFTISSGTNANSGYRWLASSSGGPAFASIAGMCCYGVFYLPQDTRDNLIRIGFGANTSVDCAYIQINTTTATLVTINNSVSTVSSSQVLVKTSPITYYEFLVEFVSATEVRCKIKNLLTGATVFEPTPNNTNVPASNRRFNLGVQAQIVTAGTSTGIIGLQEFSYGMKPNFLNDF